MGGGWRGFGQYVKRAARDPVYRARMGWLQEHERAEIVRRIAAYEDRYCEIAQDFLISEGHVRYLAKQAGVQRTQKGVGTMRTRRGAKGGRTHH